MRYAKSADSKRQSLYYLNMKAETVKQYKAVIFDILNVIFIRQNAFIYGLNEPLVEILWKLSERDITLGYMTNSSGKNVDVLVKQGIIPEFTIRINSAEACFVKPDPGIYSNLYEKLAKLNINPEEAIFIDDKPANLEPAARIGINVIHYTDFESLRADIKRLGINLS